MNGVPRSGDKHQVRIRLYLSQTAQPDVGLRRLCRARLKHKKKRKSGDRRRSCSDSFYSAPFPPPSINASFLFVCWFAPICRSDPHKWWIPWGSQQACHWFAFNSLLFPSSFAPNVQYGRLFLGLCATRRIRLVSGLKPVHLKNVLLSPPCVVVYCVAHLLFPALSRLDRR